VGKNETIFHSQYESPKGDKKMERANQEMVAIEQTLAEVADQQVRELSDLQLAFVGGGAGDTVMQ